MLVCDDEPNTTADGMIQAMRDLSRLGFLILAFCALAGVPLMAANDDSSAKAIEIADEVMARLGGREAWDETHFVTWNFFGRRRHVWDKYSGDIRVEGKTREEEQPYTILMNLHSREGRVWLDGNEVTDAAELAEWLDRGDAAWINDSYWVFMPYKLEDTGVTLEYLGDGTMQDDRAAQILQLTFEAVGRTPENKYYVYVADDTGLVEQWDFFAKATDEEPGFQVPWHNWQRYGAIMLSDDRGKNDHTDLAVFDSLPPAVLSDPSPVDWEELIP